MGLFVGRWRASYCRLHGWIAYPPQIGLDSKTPILIVLWKDAHAVGMFSVEAVLAFMIEGLPLEGYRFGQHIYGYEKRGRRHLPPAW